MAERFDKPNEVVEFIRSMRHAYSNTASAIGTRVGMDLCYYQGAQWLKDSVPAAYQGTKIGRLFTDHNPDSSKLRVTMNRTTRWVIKANASTHPVAMEADVLPLERDCGPEALFRNKVIEDLLHVSVDTSGYLAARQRVNRMRGIVGSWFLGFALQSAMREIDGERTLDQRVVAFDASPLSFTLDSFNTSPELRDHDWLVYHDVWTKRKIASVFGGDKRVQAMLKNDDAWSTVGDLTPFEQEFNKISSGKLFTQYRQHSKTPGARVHQYHTKDDTDRYGTMFVVIEPADGEPVVINWDEPKSPFGGDGLPWFKYDCHNRGDEPWAISHTSMLRDDQDRANLVASLLYRQIQKNAGFQVWYDSRSFKRGTSEEQIRRKFTNQVGGSVGFDMGRRDENIMAPQLVQHPTPPPFLAEYVKSIGDNDMRDQVYRAEGHSGVTKSHVPLGAFNRAIEEADQVLGIMVRNDVQQDEKALRVLTGTQVRLVQDGAYSVLRSLNKHGFVPEDYAEIVQSDPNDPPCTIKVRESTVRHVSHNTKRDRLDYAMSNQAMDPLVWRLNLAELDAPLSSRDRDMKRKAEEAARDVVFGMEWEPVPLGEYNEWFVREFRSAALDKRAKQDPETKQRLIRAINVQLQAAMVEAMASDPQAAMQMQQQQQPGLGPTASAAELLGLAGVDQQAGGGVGVTQPALAGAVA